MREFAQAKVGDLVYQGDAVATGADGKVGINFTDGTSFNLSSNGAGTPAGAHTPYQELTSKSATPDSCIVGTSGRSG